MKPFDLQGSDLSGIHLIEASAGTGKTYTIAGLFVRLIIEKELKVEEILVVTFTKASTDELKDRIRQSLLRAKTAFEARSSEDSFLKSMLLRINDHTKASMRLYDAITEFDKASIFTIHGFCQRILKDNAFETRLLFDSTVISDQSEYLKVVAEDFFRNAFYDAPMEFLAYASRKWPDPSTLIQFLSSLSNFDIAVIPESDENDLTCLEGFRSAYRRLQEIWTAHRDDVKNLLFSPDLNGTSYGGLKEKSSISGESPRHLKVEKLFRSMDSYLLDQLSGYPVFEDFEKFTAYYIEKHTKKNKPSPLHLFFDECDEFWSKYKTLSIQMEMRFIHLKSEAISYCDKKLRDLKEKANVLYFDDLLYYVDRALSSREKDDIVRALTAKYRSALVDEFQDTDFIQYKIFSMLFPEKTHTLFMIGDPKQAIYGFRGADVFSYLKAVRDTRHRHTLTHNWRSSPQLIQAVNSLFKAHSAPFVFDDIVYLETIPARKEENNSVSGKIVPMIIWYLTAEDLDVKKLTKSISEELIYHAVSDEIARLIGESQDSSRPSDFAVLVRTNSQAQNFKKHLSDRQIPSVLYSAGSVMETHEAEELSRILFAIAHPSNESSLKSALATDIIGKNAGDLFSDGEKDSIVEAYYFTFRHYHDLWQKEGFIAMFREMMTKESVKIRLLSYFDGERRLTNLLHLSELLHQTSVEKDLGIRELLKWFRERQTEPAFDADTQQIRLESDRHSVKIITIHKSKGLEYHTVICPFLWTSGRKPKDEFFFHDKEHDFRQTVSLSPEASPHVIDQARREQLAEEMRLLYVALTRAKHNCYVIYAHTEQDPPSPLAYLFFEKYLKKEGNLSDMDRLITLLSHMNREMLTERFREIERASDGMISVFPLPKTQNVIVPENIEEKHEIIYRPFSGKIKTKWNVSSFSSMVEGAHKKSFWPSMTEEIEKDVLDGLFYERGSVSLSSEDNEEKSIFTFPGGSRTGIFFHELLEVIDYSNHSREYLAAIVQSKLRSHGFDLSHESVILDALHHLLYTSYSSKSSSLVLSNIRKDQRITEMEFYYPIHIKDSTDAIFDLFRNHTGIRITKNLMEPLKFLFLSASEGFMKGYIDLVFQYDGMFYVLDWKSNHLGGTIDDYSRDKILDAMEKECYVLQYHIYALALHLYLRRRFPLYSYEKCFGGVFYLFLRGIRMEKKDSYGVFFDLPSKELIDGLERILLPRNDY